MCRVPESGGSHRSIKGRERGRGDTPSNAIATTVGAGGRCNSRVIAGPSTQTHSTAQQVTLQRAKPALAAGPIAHRPSTFVPTLQHAGILAPAAGILATARRGTESRPRRTAQTRARSRPERSRSTPHSAHSAQLTRAESGCPDQYGAQTGPHNRDTRKHALRNGTECPGRGSAPLRRCRAARSPWTCPGATPCGNARPARGRCPSAPSPPAPGLPAHRARRAKKTYPEIRGAQAPQSAPHHPDRPTKQNCTTEHYRK